MTTHYHNETDVSIETRYCIILNQALEICFHLHCLKQLIFKWKPVLTPQETHNGIKTAA
tara:strand:- start:51 stop:227 length:177 start_codon:yes stop_codon:yes gene_type:complete